MNGASNAFHVVSWIAVALAILSSIFIATDLPRRQPQKMFVMNLVWPINALWAGPVGVWMYWQLGRAGPRSAAQRPRGKSAHDEMQMAPHPFWQKVVPATLHCGAGCTLADLIGPFVSSATAFTLFSSLVFGEWTIDYIVALVIGVTFQYMALAPMLDQHGPRIWWRALKVDFLSLTAWQVGMYGWMALVMFVWIGRLRLEQIEFWFMMQCAMACGFCTSYPMNWWLIKAGVKTSM